MDVQKLITNMVCSNMLRNDGCTKIDYQWYALICSETWMDGRTEIDYQERVAKFVVACTRFKLQIFYVGHKPAFLIQKEVPSSFV